MSQYQLIIFYISIVLLHNISGHISDEDAILDNYDHEMLPDLAQTITELESLGNRVRNISLSDEDYMESTEKIYHKMVLLLEDLTKQINNPDDAYKFIKLSGLKRIISDNIKLDHEELKSGLLLLTKGLFQKSSSTTSAGFPVYFVDSILDIFDHENAALKALAVDILSLWLPNNPKVQARVMKLKGLVPFYEQITNLDNTAVKNLLDLFNKILEEHVKVRNGDKTIILDAEKKKYYQRIGLIELMSTPMICNGLLNIFTTSWQYDSEDNYMLYIILETIKNSKQFCWRYYEGNEKAVKLFSALKAYVEDSKNVDNFVKNGINSNDYLSIVVDYLDKIVVVRDEL